MEEIRKAKKEDEKEIAKILMEESSKPPYDEKYTFEGAKGETSRLAKGDLYVAVDGCEIVGFIASNITESDKEKVYISELWLKKKFQGKGIGKRLVEFIEDYYRTKGVKKIRLVSKIKSKAFGFYKKLNYKEYKEMVFMEKKL